MVDAGANNFRIGTINIHTLDRWIITGTDTVVNDTFVNIKSIHKIVGQYFHIGIVDSSPAKVVFAIHSQVINVTIVVNRIPDGSVP